MPSTLPTIEASMRRDRNPAGLPQKAEGRAVDDIRDPNAAVIKPPLIPQGIRFRQGHPEQPGGVGLKLEPKPCMRRNGEGAPIGPDRGAKSEQHTVGYQPESPAMMFDLFSDRALLQALTSLQGNPPMRASKGGMATISSDCKARFGALAKPTCQPACNP